MNPDLRRALLIAWLILAAAGALLAAAPLVLPEERLFGWTAPCKGCALCGMTTAFASIGRGEWDQARRANRGGIPLYSALVINAGLAVGWAARRR